MGEVNNALRGRQVAAVITNGQALVIQCHDGTEIQIAWVDDDGKPAKGRPIVQAKGLRMRAEKMHELIAMPAGARL